MLQALARGLLHVPCYSRIATQQVSALSRQTSQLFRRNVHDSAPAVAFYKDRGIKPQKKGPTGWSILNVIGLLIVFSFGDTEIDKESE